jgi:hypothetical protein
MANMTAVIKVNGVVCEMLNSRTIKMYGRKKTIHFRPTKTTDKMVENHIFTGRWFATKMRT